MLDARAGSPPCPVVLLRRHAGADQESALRDLLRDGERWGAERLESHLSYPILAYYRSQHERESWLAALTVILDVPALVIVGVGGEGRPQPQAARLAFAAARHAAADVSYALGRRPAWHGPDRLPDAELARRRAPLRLSLIHI